MLRVFLVLFLFLSFVSNIWAHGAGVSAESFTGTNLTKGAWSAEFSFEYHKWDELGHRNAHALHEAGRDLHNFDHDEYYSAALAYGVTDDLEIAGSIGYVQKTFLHVADGFVGNGDDSDGIGDLTILGKYRVYKDELDVAVLGGVKFPTGETSEKGITGNKLEAEEQPGTGSYDYIVGLAAGKSMGRWSLGGDVIYTFKTEGAQGYELGDVTQLDLRTRYALREPGIFPNVHLTGEVNLQFVQKDDKRGKEVFDSGAEILFLTPGVDVDLNDTASVFFSFSVPVYQDRGGEHSEIDYQLKTGVTLNFG